MDELLKKIKEAQNSLDNLCLCSQGTLPKQNGFECEEINLEDTQNCLIKTNIRPEQLLFEGINENVYSKNHDLKIVNLKMNSVTSRRKDELFKRYRKEQEEKIVQRRRQLQGKYGFSWKKVKESGQFTLKMGDKSQIFTIKSEDFQTLRPETDLNDTIINNYIKIMLIFFLPQQISQQTHIFSSFFISKLLTDQFLDQNSPKHPIQFIKQKVLHKISQTYISIKRWTRKLDIFNKNYLVFPINAFKHWNCIFVINPGAILTNPSLCKILYLDSMCEMEPLLTLAIKKYLEHELEERKNIILNLEMLDTYQLIVPRQTNTHDCGLYTLCFIESFLKKAQILNLNFQNPDNRIQLTIFPRSLIFTMRENLHKLFQGLLLQQKKQVVLQKYLKCREQILQEALPIDYDEINQQQFRKYFGIQSSHAMEKQENQQQLQLLYKIRFYLDFEINHYEKNGCV